MNISIDQKLIHYKQLNKVGNQAGTILQRVQNLEKAKQMIKPSF